MSEFDGVEEKETNDGSSENGEMTNQKEESKSERNAVILGTKHKATFFKNLCDAANKYERHVHYQDVHYLTIEHQGTESVVEVTDPGLARTGGREMALRNADFIILYYSSVSMDSLQALHPLIQPLQTRKNVPILLVCDSDEVVLEETASANMSSSASEGYESDDRDGMKRHYSMEQIRKGLDDNVDSVVDQGEKFSSELGNRCTFLQVSSSNSSDAKKVLTQMIISLNKSVPIRNRRQSIIKNILRSKSSDKSGGDGMAIEAVNGEKNGKKKTKVEDSKVCVVM